MSAQIRDMDCRAITDQLCIELGKAGLALAVEDQESVDHVDAMDVALAR